MKIYLINFSKWEDSKLKSLFAWPNESMINVKIKTLGNFTYLKVALFIFKEYFKTVIFVYLIKMLVFLLGKKTNMFVYKCLRQSGLLSFDLITFRDRNQMSNREGFHSSVSFA